ncbi:MAG: glycosyltransferase [Nitrospira sp.]
MISSVAEAGSGSGTRLLGRDAAAHVAGPSAGEDTAAALPSAPFRLTIVNKYYPPHLGGIEYHVCDLARGLASRGFDVQVLVANEGGALAVERMDDVTVVRLPRLFAYSSTPVSPRLPSAIRRAGAGGGAASGAMGPGLAGAGTAGLIHLHFPFPWGEVSWLLARSPAPVVLTYHSDIVRQERARRDFSNEHMVERTIEVCRQSRHSTLSRPVNLTRSARAAKGDPMQVPRS